MDLRTGILESANALGMDPSWLATIISYETGGTFSPTQPGPTTQFGQHRGLIQFGEPQAQQYGVDWNNPLGSQLGRDGAVVRYFKDRGWQPGMNFANAYATVNAGNPNRVNASDANNGGAPGTVLDKVNNQMAGHWQNAARVLGGDFTPPQSNGAPMTPTVSTQSPGLLGQQQPQKRGLLGMDTEKLNRIGLAMMAASGYQPFQPLIQAQFAEMRDARKERAAAAQKNQTVELLRGINPQMAALYEGGVLSASDAYKMATGNGGATEYGLTPQFYVDENGDVKMGVLGKDGTFKPVEVPGDITRGVEKIDLGDRWRFVNVNTGEVIGEQMKNIREAASEEQIGSASGKAAGEAITGASGARARANQIGKQIDSLLNDPFLPNMIGPIDSRLPNVSGDANRVQSKIDQVLGQAFLEGRSMLKGGGAITDFESNKAEQAFIRANTAQNEADFRAAMTEFRDAVRAGAEKLEAQARTAGAEVPASTPVPQGDDPLGLR